MINLFKWSICFLILNILFINQTYSQVNIESLRENLNDKSYFLEIGAGFLGQTGNNNIITGDAKFTFHYKQDNNYCLIKGETVKGKKDSEYFVDNSFAHVRYTKMFYQLLGGEIFTQIQDDKFKKLKLRQLNGLGIRSEIFKGEKDIISFGIGGMTDYEIIEKDGEFNFRGTSYISIIHGFDKENKNQLILVGYYQPLFVNLEDYRINAELNLKSSLIETLNISLELSVVYLYDTNPPAEVLTNDLIIKTGLLLKI